LDLLSSLSRDQLHTLSWIAAIVFALAAGVWRPRMIHWTALGSVLLFAALNAGAGIYVLNHFTDPRWSSGGETPLTAPSFSGTPLVGQYLAPLDSALKNVVGEVNDFLAFKQALPTALDFLAVSGWALLVSFPIAAIAAGISYTTARRRAAEAAKYRAVVDQLRDELDQVRLEITTRRAVEPAPAAHEVATEFRLHYKPRGSQTLATSGGFEG
jgi:hypothetical protein